MSLTAAPRQCSCIKIFNYDFIYLLDKISIFLAVQMIVS